mmetsp:Transcript_29565/g.26144  ORF Transcript_29565/g.26144 Transcript_29565/m.26144 type:complete len:126 (+) Transcript_29565:604-981(+)
MEYIIQKRRSSKKKGNTKQSKEMAYIYLRPFLKAFFKALKKDFRIVLYSYYDFQTFQSLTECFDAVFGESYFDGFLCFPTKRKNIDTEAKFRNIRDFLSTDENRNLNNCFFIDSSLEFLNANKHN